jgi:hypothetical protein
MRNRKFIICLLLMVLLSFGLISCGKQTVATTTAKVAEVITTTAKAITTIQTTTTQEATTTVEETTTTISQEEALSAVKAALQDYLSENFNAELTKFFINTESTKMVIAYNTEWGSPDRIKKELYDVIKGLVSGDGWSSKADMEVSATNGMGDTIKTNTTYDNLKKINALEMSYDDWLKIAF